MNADEIYQKYVLGPPPYNLSQKLFFGNLPPTSPNIGDIWQNEDKTTFRREVNENGEYSWRSIDNDKLTWGPRRSGRTTAQIKACPPGAVFVSTHDCSYLAKCLNRPDLMCISHRDSKKLRGGVNLNIFIDHYLWEINDNLDNMFSKNKELVEIIIMGKHPGNTIQTRDECIQFLNQTLNFHDPD
jgi:hypothetical protein